MSNNGPFGFDPEDIDRVTREAGEGLRDALGRLAGSSPRRVSGPDGLRCSTSLRGARVPGMSRRRPGEAGDGVWAIYTVDAAGGAHIEEVYATELDALRANKSNTDPTRKVRFLPYGIGVSVLDATEATEDCGGDD